MNVSHRIATRTEVISTLALALVLAAVLAADTSVTAARHDNWPFELGVGAVTCLLAIFRARHRVLAVTAGLVVCAAAGVTSDTGHLPSQPGFAATLALLVLGAAGIRVARRLPAVLIAVAGVAVLVAGRTGLRGEYVVAFGFLGTASWGCALAIGLWMRLLDIRRRLAIDTARHDERLELARELHDVVAHHVAGIVVQAQAARIAAARHPESLDTTLASIESAGHDALAAMRRVVGLLRDPSDSSGRAPGPEQLSDLVGRFAGHGPAIQLHLPASGQTASASTGSGKTASGQAASASTASASTGSGKTASGGRAPWPPEVSTTVYRIVQEALTNVTLHAPGATSVTVTVGEDDSAVTVEVTDDAPRRALSAGPWLPAAGGHGLVGMRERAEALGGALHAGPGPDGGWVVSATLPLPARRNA